MTRYAAQTTVPIAKSVEDIRKLLTKHGCDGFAYGEERGKAMLAFTMKTRRVRFLLVMPDRMDREFTHTKDGWSTRTEPAASKLWEQACRQRYRALLLILKAKFEALDLELASFDEEFLGYFVLPTGQTVADVMLGGELDRAMSAGELPALMPGLSQSKDPEVVEAEIVEAK